MSNLKTQQDSRGVFPEARLKRIGVKPVVESQFNEWRRRYGQVKLETPTRERNERLVTSWHMW